jgi:hypothetical protein
MACSHTGNCELYVQFAADPSIEVWKNHFCNSNYKKCARYNLSLSGASVPLNLLPNGKEIAHEVGTVDVGLNTLFNAIQKDRIPMISALLKTKVSDGKIANSAGVTPLMYAASLGRTAIVELFLENGCNPHYQCNQGQTALDYARQGGHSECATIVETYMSKVAPIKETNTTTVKQHKESLFGKLFGFLRRSHHQQAA